MSDTYITFSKLYGPCSKEMVDWAIKLKDAVNAVSGGDPLRKKTPEDREIAKLAHAISRNTFEGSAHMRALHDKDGVWFLEVCSDSGGENVDTTVEVCQAVLRKFNRPDFWSLEFAETDSRNVHDSAGGGAVVFSATTASWLSTSQWVAEELVRMGAKPK